MRRGSTAFFGCLFLLACAPSKPALDAGGASADGGDGGAPDGGFDFSSCPTDAGNYPSCPNLFGMYCRMRILRAAFASGCSTDTDCVKASYEYNCISYGECELKPAVRVVNETPFHDAVRGELSPYCASTGCRNLASCFAQTTQAVCVAGMCQTVVVDGGG